MRVGLWSCEYDVKNRLFTMYISSGLKYEGILNYTLNNAFGNKKIQTTVPNIILSVYKIFECYIE